jgi:phi LC3 family holin
MNKINWGVRFKNKIWLASFISLIVSFVFSLLAAFDVYPRVTQSLVMQIADQVLAFLGLIGVIVDPTTAGISDSNRAMSYKEPYQDEPDNG